MPVARPREPPLCDADDVLPERLPLVLKIPDIRTLEQRDNESLRHHEHGLRRANLGFHCADCIANVEVALTQAAGSPTMARSLASVSG
jgi:hypothetical protein